MNLTKEQKEQIKKLILYVKHLKYMDGTKAQGEYTPDDILQKFTDLLPEAEPQEVLTDDKTIYKFLYQTDINWDGSAIQIIKGWQKWLSGKPTPPLNQSNPLSIESFEKCSEAICNLTPTSISKEENEIANKFNQQDYIDLLDWLNENNMGANAFGGWSGRLNTNLIGSKSKDMVREFLKQKNH